MKGALSTALALIVLAGAGVASAGPTSNDDDNDYEGRVEGNQNTYFGFDLSANGNRVNGITASLRYVCESGKSGTLLVESDGGLRVIDGEFSGKTFAESKLDLTYRTTGQLKPDGMAKGTLKAKGVFGATDKCRAVNDGEWKAKKGRDIDVGPLAAR
ncbi:MAG: hypothetical protein M3Y34_04160 [Actinomycetota bacterium]|nr:hypothetical protein [Actinomycetota bacterium]